MLDGRQVTCVGVKFDNNEQHFYCIFTGGKVSLFDEKTREDNDCYLLLLICDEKLRECPTTS